MILFGDEHGLKSIQRSLFFFVGDKDSALLTVEGAIDAGHGAKLGEDVPDVTLGQTLVVDEGDGVVSELVGLQRRQKLLISKQ